MKIGIITIHNSPNYGASLQSFALWKYIVDCGYDCELIDLCRPCHNDYIASKKYVPCRPQGKPGIIGAMKERIKGWMRSNTGFVYLRDEALQKFNDFNSQVRLGRIYRGIDELYADPPLYDVYVTGSDQLWNPTQPFCISPYLLTFAPAGKKRISYASSIGITELTREEINLFKSALGQYDAISVRELQAKILLEKIIDKEIHQVADPTFLISTDYWKSIAVYPEEKGKYILLFTLEYDAKMLDYTLGLGRQSGLKVVYLTAIQPKATGGYVAVETAGPCEWIGYIANAEMVITDSFHGTVFSIITGCNNFFIRIADDNGRGSRIMDLLDVFGLSSHLMDSGLSQTYNELASMVVDHEHVSAIVESERERSRQFLTQHIR